MKLQYTLYYLFFAFLCSGQEATPVSTFQLDEYDRPITQLVNGVIVEQYEYLTKGQPEKITFQTKTPRKFHSNFSYTYFKGDTITLSVKTRQDKVLKHLTFFYGKEVVTEASEVIEYEQKIIIEKDGKYTLELYNKWSFSSIYSIISIERKPQSIIKVKETKRDTLFQIDTLQKWVVLDTQAILVLEKEVSLPPIRDLEQSPYTIIELNLPVSVAPEARLLNWAFWIGTSQEEIEDYTFLSGNMPEEWLFKEAPPVLGAYFLNKPIALPRKKNKYVQVSMTANSPIKTLQKNQFPKSKYPISSIHNLGRVGGAKTPVSGRVFISLKNIHEINSYPIKIQVVAFQTVGEIQEHIQRKINEIKLSYKESKVSSLNLE